MWSRQSGRLGNGFSEKGIYRPNFAGEGAAEIALNFADGLFYQILSETVEMPIENDYALISTIKMLSETKQEYDKIATALNDVRRKGYGVVTPVFEEITLEKPEVFKQEAATALSCAQRRIYSFNQGRRRNGGFANHRERRAVAGVYRPTDCGLRIGAGENLDLNIFGRTLSSMVSDGMQNKIYRMPEDAQMKLQETLQKIVNEGSGGLICIIL